MFMSDSLAQYIQQTLVRPDATRTEIEQFCHECLQYQFQGAMVSPLWLKLVNERLAGTPVMICTALGYPMGGMSALAKAFEVRDVIARGARQIDFMPPVGYLKSGMYDEYRRDIETVVQAADGVPIKVMLEFGMLTDVEKRTAAELAIEAGATYLKNSSGWGQGGRATVPDIELLHEVARGPAKAKASGGIRTHEQALALLNAGAELLGTSGGVGIVGSSGTARDQY